MVQPKLKSTTTNNTDEVQNNTCSPSDEQCNSNNKTSSKTVPFWGENQIYYSIRNTCLNSFQWKI